jgi:hypothetical protein
MSARLFADGRVACSRAYQIEGTLLTSRHPVPTAVDDVGLSK